MNNAGEAFVKKIEGRRGGLPAGLEV